MLNGTDITSDRSWSNRFLKATRHGEYNLPRQPISVFLGITLGKVFLTSNLILSYCNLSPLLLAL